MTNQRAQQLTRKRDRYLKGIMRSIRKSYPSAEFEVSRRPGLKHAWLYVSAPVKEPFDIFRSVGKTWDRALSDGYSITIIPLVEPKSNQ